MSEGPDRVSIDEALVRELLSSQFPQWAHLRVAQVRPGGWDNRTFRLGDDLLVRLPSAARYAAQAEKARNWLPRLASRLPVPIPEPVGVGQPEEAFPWPWSVCRWIEGECLSAAPVADLQTLAEDLAGFLRALQAADASGGPPAGAHSFFRGGPLATYADEVETAIRRLADPALADAAQTIWAEALASAWKGPGVWVHGDFAPGNLLVRDGRLCAVIDFGQLCVGDPACDLAIAWTYLDGPARERFRDQLAVDTQTWARGRGWVLWKALILHTGVSQGTEVDVGRASRDLVALISDWRLEKGR